MMKKGREHRILEQPRAITLDIIKPKKQATIITANDLFFIEDRGHLSIVDIILGSIFFILGISIHNHGNGSFNFLDLSFIIPGLFMVIKGIFKPKKNMQLCLDRLGGTITYPAPFFGKPLTGAFNKLVVVFAVSGDIDGYSPQEYLKAVNTFRPRKLDILKTLSFKNPYNEWSLYVWYMDKNRPLPPGTAFDAYRQKDFERRKALGFPKPLYPSNVPTPEATEAQQRERLRIGGW